MSSEILANKDALPIISLFDSSFLPVGVYQSFSYPMVAVKALSYGMHLSLLSLPSLSNVRFSGFNFDPAYSSSLASYAG